MSNLQEKKLQKLPNKKEPRPKQDKCNYDDFVEWVALPRPLRKPKTYEDFAKEHGMTRQTLSRWKKKPNFWKDVADHIVDRAKDRTGTVIEKLYQKIIKDGGAQEVKLWLQYVEKWIPTEGLRTEDKTFEDYAKKVDEKIRAYNKQISDRKRAVDSKQKRRKGKVQAKPDSKPIRKDKDQKGHNSEGKAEGV